MNKIGKPSSKFHKLNNRPPPVSFGPNTHEGPMKSDIVLVSEIQSNKDEKSGDCIPVLTRGKETTKC